MAARWTEAEKSQLRRLLAAGLMFPQVAAEMGRTYRSVTMKAKYMGLSVDADVTRQWRTARAVELSSDPNVLAKRGRTVATTWTPERRKRASQIATERRLADAMRGKAHTPEIVAARTAALKRYHDKRLWWCPKDRRREYHKLARRYGVEKAKRLVLERAAKAEAARIAAMTPFERQLERVRNGAQITTRPVLAKSHDYTLGGVASGML